MFVCLIRYPLEERFLTQLDLFNVLKIHLKIYLMFIIDPMFLYSPLSLLTNLQALNLVDS